MLPDKTAHLPSGWPERMIDLAGLWNMTNPGDPKDRLLSETWVLLNAALTKYVRIHRTRHGHVSEDDVRDIASDKSMELIRKFDRGTWKPADSHPGQLCSLISKVARNGLIDHLRSEHRMRRLDGPTYSETTRGAQNHAEHLLVDGAFDLAVDGERFAEALRDCSKRLNPKLRLIWYFKSFLEMPSKSIAKHPAVGMKPASVDVVLVKARQVLRQCMHKKGFVAGDMPPGAFVTIWETIRKDVGGETGEPKA